MQARVLLRRLRKGQRFRLYGYGKDDFVKAAESHSISATPQSPLARLPRLFQQRSLSSTALHKPWKDSPAASGPFLNLSCCGFPVASVDSLPECARPVPRGPEVVNERGDGRQSAR